ncbi:MAG: polysaccharide deacetylase family protein [Syntrophomonas sp.]
MITRIIKLLISIFVFCTDSVKRLIALIAGKKLPPTCVILYYHIVNEAQRKLFCRQLETLLCLTRPIAINHKHPLNSRDYFVAITFDDAFTCILDNAVPELLKRRVPFTIFVPTGFIGKNPGWIKQKNDPQHKVMDKKQLIKLHKMDNVVIGSHCISHRDITLLSNDEAEKEISQSKSDLERFLGQKITLLSFPHGAYKKQHVTMAWEAGYERVFSILPSLAFLRSDEYETGRVRVDPDDWMLEFRLKICGAYRWLPLAFAVKKALLKF